MATSILTSLNEMVVMQAGHKKEGAMFDAVYRALTETGGSISAEHGIGTMKTEQLKDVKDPVALKMMHAIKNTLDPKGLLNRK